MSGAVRGLDEDTAPGPSVKAGAPRPLRLRFLRRDEKRGVRNDKVFFGFGWFGLGSQLPAVGKVPVELRSDRDGRGVRRHMCR